MLKEHNVLEENIILSNLFCTPIAAKSLITAFPKVISYLHNMSNVYINVYTILMYTLMSNLKNINIYVYVRFPNILLFLNKIILLLFIDEDFNIRDPYCCAKSFWTKILWYGLIIFLYSICYKRDTTYNA